MKPVTDMQQLAAHGDRVIVLKGNGADVGDLPAAITGVITPITSAEFTTLWELTDGERAEIASGARFIVTQIVPPNGTINPLAIGVEGVA